MTALPPFLYYTTTSNNCSSSLTINSTYTNKWNFAIKILCIFSFWPNFMAFSPLLLATYFIFYTHNSHLRILPSSRRIMCISWIYTSNILKRRTHLVVNSKNAHHSAGHRSNKKIKGERNMWKWYFYDILIPLATKAYFTYHCNFIYKRRMEWIF